MGGLRRTEIRRSVGRLLVKQAFWAGGIVVLRRACVGTGREIGGLEFELVVHGYGYGYC